MPMKEAMRACLKNRISERVLDRIKGSPLLKSFRVQKAIALWRRWMAMHGISNLFMRHDPVEYWQSQTSDSIHNPMQYLIPDEMTELMFADISKRLGYKTSFIEIGCNSGGNLKYLFDLGYRNLAGIEINRYAVEEVLKKEYPELYDVCNFYVGNASEEIKKIRSSSFDVVFSKAVLIHIPPSQRSLFREMVRISKKYIVVYTSEVGLPFPYDFDKVFNELGCKTVLYRSFYGEKNYSKLPIDLYYPQKHYFQETFLRIFVKKAAHRRTQ